MTTHNEQMRALAQARRTLAEDPAKAARRVVTQRDGVGGTRERVYLTTYDAGADGRAERSALLVRAVPEVDAVLALHEAASYRGRDHDTSVLLHTFAGPACVIRSGGEPSGLHRMFLGRDETLTQAARVLFTTDTLAGLHAGVGRSDPERAGEVASPWVDGVWCVGPAEDGSDPRLAALRRLAGEATAGVQATQGWFLGHDPVSLLAGWLVGSGRNRVTNYGYPAHGWVGEDARQVMPRLQLPGRPYATKSAAEEWIGTPPR